MEGDKMYEIYKVKDDDTIESIAEERNINKEMIYEINDIDENYDIFETREIILPKNKNKIFNYYKVKKGDNIYEISKKNNIDYEMLLKLNGLDKEDYIYPDQTLLIPNSKYKLYITKDGDTLSNITERNDIKALIENNKNIYLQSEQLIIIDKKVD